MDEFSGVAVLAGPGGALASRVGGSVDERMAFQIASGSKQFTACAVLLLVDRGLVALDDPLVAYLDGGQSGVSVHQLLSHTSRIGHWETIPGLDLSDLPDAGAVKELIVAAPLGEPGWVYSSPGYVLLAHVVEAVSGRPYAEFVSSEILEPLGLADTTVAVAPAFAAEGYHGGRPIGGLDLAAIPGAGDLWSTAADQVRFVRAIHAERRLLSASSYEVMCTAHGPLDETWRTEDGWLGGESCGYGVGIGVIGGEPAYFHPGDNSGFRSFRAWLPETDRAAVVLSNDDACDPLPVLRDLLG
ncbi:CubicO group peptidase (beta-lactamase class C family) [Kribbella amoyensis]|uniref:CubicO group peptidase (Beta-lactamase class C family) n=1 Tax=Kribbella amoyensis TaxID=996641 RepID=A0A561BS00_9ACTN|nr:CubicO group peptidase (beta-lactamase class C family) [Kribbella amoyensis]